MDTKYVGLKELSEGGSAGIILFGNIVLVKKLLDSDGCDDDAKCVNIVILFLSIGLHVAIPVLVTILAVLENKNEKTRKKNKEIRKKIKKIQKQNKRIRRENRIKEEQKDEIPVIADGCKEEELQRRTENLKYSENTNDRINIAILVLTVIGGLLNIAINGIELK